MPDIAPTDRVGTRFDHLAARVMGTAYITLGLGNLLLPVALQSFRGAMYLTVSAGLLAAYHCLRIPYYLQYPRLLLWLFVYLVMVGPGILMADSDVDYSVTKVFSLAFTYLLISTPVIYERRALFLKASTTLIATGSAVVAFALLLVPSTEGSRSSVFGLNPIGAGRGAGLLGAICIGVLAFRIINGKARRIWLVFPVLISGYAVITTGSRGPLSAMLITIAVMVHVTFLRSKHRLTASIVFTALVGLVVWAIQTNQIRGMDRILQQDSSGRDVILADTASLIRQRPLGIGWGMMGEYFPEHADVDTGAAYPHNLYFELALEGGLILGIIALIMSVFIIKKSIALTADIKDPQLYIWMAIFVYSLAGAQFSSDINGNRLLWLSAGVLIVYFAERNKVAQSEEQVNDQ